jgi:hypothetical protein
MIALVETVDERTAHNLCRISMVHLPLIIPFGQEDLGSMLLY